ncbi:hypothetical protein TNCV_159591 [Trichonephila clavipes]|uniref:Uncharacterized protein n=1 Tax=Trichonephila clavipes TaxID=2585209 RepID=A0A8X6R8N8_TRICX|nr:hypothetical protein TNCV_159591 [Trichonephila clavipes]
MFLVILAKGRGPHCINLKTVSQPLYTMDGSSVTLGFKSMTHKYGLRVSNMTTRLRCHKIILAQWISKRICSFHHHILAYNKVVIHSRYCPPSWESSLAPNPDSADFAVFLVRFAEGTSLGLPQKSVSSREELHNSSLSKLLSLQGLYNSTSKIAIFYRCEGLTTAPFKTAILTSDSLTPLIYPLLSHPIHPHHPLMFCPFSAPIGLGSFELLSLCRPRRSRHIPSLAPWEPMSGYTLYVSRRAVINGIRGKRKLIVDASLCDAADPVPKFLPNN